MSAAENYTIVVGPTGQGTVTSYQRVEGTITTALDAATSSALYEQMEQLRG